MKLVHVGRFGVGVYNVNGRYFGLTNYCPHRGGPLCLGRVTGLVEAGPKPYQVLWSRAGEILRCPWHGMEFEIATGRSVVKPRFTVKSYPVRVSDGVGMLEGL